MLKRDPVELIPWDDFDLGEIHKFIWGPGHSTSLGVALSPFEVETLIRFWAEKMVNEVLSGEKKENPLYWYILARLRYFEQFMSNYSLHQALGDAGAAEGDLEALDRDAYSDQRI